MAKLVTEVFAPGVLVVAVLLAVGWHSTHSLAGVGWGMLAALFCGVIPYAVIIAGVRLGYWTDHHVRERRQRFVPLLITVGCVVAGLVALVLLGGPRDVFALVVAMLAGLVSTMTVTRWWKISVHTAVAAGVVVVLALSYGAVVAATAPVVALIGWSRVRLGDHTPAQTVAGSALGAVVSGVFFALLS